MKKTKGLGGRKKGDAGALARNFPRPLQWKVDQDYLKKLSPEEREWLARFNDAHYGGDFRGQEHEWSVEERRAVWSANNSARRDVYTLADTAGALSLGDEDENNPTLSLDVEPTPEYLNSELYKAARDKFRETGTEKARKRLKVFTPPTKDDDNDKD